MIRWIGYVLLTVGFLAGALAATVEVTAVFWEYFVPAVVLGAVGVGMLWYGHRRASRGEQKLAGDIEAMSASLRRIAHNAAELDQQKHQINVYDIPDEIDRRFAEDLTIFVQARESIARAYGLGAYADLMSDFAAAERYLNRVWSASVDGYVDEACEYLAKARQQFEQSLTKLEHLRAGETNI